MPTMEHSITAKYAARPAARFPRALAGNRQRRLGLGRPTRRVPPGPGPDDRAPARPAFAVRPPPPRLALDRRDPPGATLVGSTPAGRLADVAAIGLGAPPQRPLGAVARLRSATATSAGGIVVRTDQEGPSLVVGMRRRERDSATWTLPKGTPDPGETVEETALREVAEETGLEVRIVEPLPSIEYSFVQPGTRIHKTVHYFLMEPVGGDLSRHDHEFERGALGAVRRGARAPDVRPERA